MVSVEVKNTEIKEQKKENINENKNILASTFGGQKRWVNWKGEELEEGNIKKLPISVNGRTASTADPLTWSTYKEVVNISQEIGIVFTPDQLLLGIDIDHCLNGNEIVHEEKEKIIELIEEAETYTEISPSKTGLHLFLSLTSPLQLIANRKGPFEAYTSGRYFTVTNNPFNEVLPIRTVTTEEAIELLSIIGYPWGKEVQQNIVVPVNTPSQDDATILSKMFASKIGDKIKLLYDGGITAYDNDPSRADMALCSYLAYWTECNAEQMKRMWLNSPLGKRDKTQNRKDYTERTIAVAIQSQQDKKKDIALEIYERANFKINFLNPKLKKEVSYEIAKYLINKYHVKTIGERIRDIYIYKNGIYVLGLNDLKAEIQNILEELTTQNDKNNIIEMVKDSTLADRKDFDVDKNLINLNNGIFDVKNKQFIPHDPKYLFFTKIPVNYDANATCPIIGKFLNEILPEEYIKIILQWFGYCLYRNYFIKKAIIFVGERDTGKSTLLKLFARFIGEENTSGVSLHKIASDKFASSCLYNKHLNAYDELSPDDINDNGSFKMAVGGGIIGGEKKFGEQFEFLNYSKLTFACNKIPDVKDAGDDAYFSRWIIVPFLAEIAKVDKFLTDKITAKEELAGLLNLALLGLSDILQKQNFSYVKNPGEIKKEMLLSGSMIANFAEECLEEEADAWISKDDMYDECAKYTLSKNLPTVTKEFLGRKLPNHSGYIIDSTKKNETKQVRGWRNVKIKSKG